MKKSSFLKNTSTLLTGNVIGQIIGIVAIPIITRVYSIEVYGIFASILALSVILSTFTTLSLHLAILLPKKDTDAYQVLVITFCLTLLSSLVLLVLIFVFEGAFIELLGISEQKWLIYTLPVLVWLQSTYLTFTYWGVRKLKVKTVSLSKVVESIADRGFAIVLGLISSVSAVGLIVARIVSSLLAIISLKRVIDSSELKARLLAISQSDVKSTVQQHKNFIKYNTPSMLLINAMLQLPTILVATYLSPIAAGVYAIANRIVNIPVNVLGSAISKTYMQKVATDYNDSELDCKKVRLYTYEFFSSFYAVLLILFSALAALGEEVFPILLGDKWQQAGVIASYLSYFAMTTLLAQSFGGLFDVTNKQNIRFVYQIFNFLIRIGVLFFCLSNDFDIEQTVLIYSVAAMSMNFLAIWLLLNCINASYILLKVVSMNFIPLALFWLGVLFIENYSDSLYVTFAGVVVFVAIWFFKVINFEQLRVSYGR